MMNDNNNIENNDVNGNKKKSIKLIVLFLIIFALLFAGVYFGMAIGQKNAQTPDNLSNVTVTQSAEKTVENPIDIAKLQKQNDEIYAYIKIDDTKVDCPIVQSGSDDAFYLRHKAEDKSWSASGAIYTEVANSKDFDDFVTVIYGHNGYSDTFFTTLHYFEKEEFFNSHPYFYIYTPKRKLTYQVISAFKYDNRHILNSFDFNKEASIKEWQDTITNPTSSLKNVRKNLDVPLSINSKIVVLSTCITNQRNNRYLVCGELVKDEKTN